MDTVGIAALIINQKKGLLLFDRAIKDYGIVDYQARSPQNMTKMRSLRDRTVISFA